MRCTKVLVLLLLGLLSVSPVFAGTAEITSAAGGSGGSGGGGASATATAANPTYVEGYTNAALSIDLSGGLRTTLITLLACEDQTSSLCRTSGGVVRSTVMATAVTTNTTSTAVAVPTGSKSIYGSVDGTGAITQTQAIYGGLTSGVTSTTGQLLCTLTLSGTTHVHDTCPVIAANFLFYIIVTTATTGTGASGNVTAMY